jgi:hypothetical protein
MPKQQTDGSRKRVEIRFYLGFAGVFIAGGLLGVALVSAPKLLVETKFIVALAVGLVPVLLLNSDYRYRYLAFVLATAGFSGLLGVARDNFGCVSRLVLGQSYFCPIDVTPTRIAFVSLWYLLLLGTGLSLVLKVTKRNQEKRQS